MPPKTSKASLKKLERIYSFGRGNNFQKYTHKSAFFRVLTSFNCVLSFNFHKSSPSARRCAWAFITSQRLAQSSLYSPNHSPHPTKSESGASALSLRSLWIICTVPWTQLSIWVGKFVLTLSWEYFFYSSQSLFVHCLPPALVLQPSSCHSYPSISSECSASLGTLPAYFHQVLD